MRASSAPSSSFPQRRHFLRGASVRKLASALETTKVQVDAKSILVKYYEAYNAGDLKKISTLLSEDCVYHDMIYDEPFVGRQEVITYLAKVRKTVPNDLKFVIDDITDGTSEKVGVIWHVECGDQIEFPFSRGCSFYNVNGAGEIIYARDLVESAAKPGSSALKILGAMTPVIRDLGEKADPGILKKLPIESALVWAFYAGYMAYIMFSTGAHGPPAYATPLEDIVEVLNESLNFFYVNIALSAAGLSAIPSVPCPPVSEAVFNFMNAWGMMFLPVIMSEAKSQKVEKRWLWWTALMFVTNVFFIPFLAKRAELEPVTPSNPPRPSANVPPAGVQACRSLAPRPPPTLPLPGYAPALGWLGASVGAFSLVWAAVGRPEFGGLAERAAYFASTMDSNRVFYAFVVDACLYCVWQAILIPEAPPQQRFVPFFGLAAYLTSKGEDKDEKAL